MAKRQQSKKRRRKPRIDWRKAHSDAFRQSCPSNTTPYRSREKAERAMRRAREMAGPGDEVPRRVYLCPECSKWHLTKIEEWKEW